MHRKQTASERFALLPAGGDRYVAPHAPFPSMSPPLLRHIRRAGVEGLHDGAVPEETLRAWGKNFPPNAARRMTRLGLMLGAALKDFPIDPADSVVYASTYGETIATERYLDSFPGASPLFFQTSIHPSAIEQVLINRACPVRELTPLAGETDLAAQAALTALLTPSPRVLLTGGEEIGAWLKDLNAASGVAFAFALELSDNERDAIGLLRWDRGAETVGTAGAGLHDLFCAVRDRSAWTCPTPAGGAMKITWH